MNIFGWNPGKALGIEKVKPFKPAWNALDGISKFANNSGITAALPYAAGAAALFAPGLLGPANGFLRSNIAKAGNYLGKSNLGTLQKAMGLYQTAGQVTNALGITKTPEQRLAEKQMASLAARDKMFQDAYNKTMGSNEPLVSAGNAMENRVETGYNQAGAESSSRGITNSSYNPRSMYDSYARNMYNSDLLAGQNAKLAALNSLAGNMSTASDYNPLAQYYAGQRAASQKALANMGTADAYGINPFDDMYNNVLDLFGGSKPSARVEQSPDSWRRN